MFITGTQSADILGGTSGDDIISGLGGDDQIDAGAGNDIIDGGEGNDHIEDGAGDDIVDGGEGADQISSSGGSDNLRGGGGNDNIFISRGNNGTTEYVLIDGGTGNDSVTYQNYRRGSLNADLGDGDDRIDIWNVQDEGMMLTLGSGRDVVHFSSLSQTNLKSVLTITDFKAGAQGDRLDLVDSLNASLIGWDGSSNPFGTSGYLRLVQSATGTLLQIDRDGSAAGNYGFETLISMFDVQASGLTADNLFGFRGDGQVMPGIILNGTGADDILAGTSGGDTLNGLGGSDQIDGGAGDDIINGGEGDDVIHDGAGNDVVDGGDGNDQIESSGGSDVLRGGGGNDTFFISRGNNGTVENVRIEGGSGNDAVTYQNYRSGSLIADLGAGNDQITIWSVQNGGMQLALGSGQDTVRFASLSQTNLNGVLTITDFATGPQGDRLDLTDSLNASLIGWNGRTDIFDAGYARLVQSGADTLLQIDRDGVDATGNYDFVTLVKFQNVQASSISAFNLSGLKGGGIGGTFYGSAANDWILASAGTDEIYAGAGDDLIDGGQGRDYIFGDDGSDTVSYSTAMKGVVIDLAAQTTWDGRHNDILSSIENAIGSAYSDNIRGDRGANILDGGTGGVDRIDGGAGSDTVSYASSLNGMTINLATGLGWDGRENDQLISIENVVGSSFNDDIRGDGAANVLDGGAGGADRIDGAGGLDTVSYASSSRGVTIDLAANLSWDGRHNDQLISIENAIGSLYNDNIRGDDKSNVLNGGVGGADRIDGAGGIDTVSYSLSYRGVTIDLAADLSWDGVNNDQLISIENAIGSAFNDTIRGDGASNVLDGGAGGADRIDGAGGLDTVSYVSSLRGVTIDLASDLSWDGRDNDQLISIENAIGSAFNDVIRGDSASNILDGGAGGADRIDGAGGIDTVSYASSTRGVIVDLASGLSWDGQDNDTLTSIENATGSAFGDQLIGTSADNILRGGGGNDVYKGGAGADRFVIDTWDGGRYADRILDFSYAAGDRIDLTEFDADLTSVGQQKANLVNAFTGNAGQIVMQYDAADHVTMLYADRDGDGAADYSLTVFGDSPLSSDWLLI